MFSTHQVLSKLNLHYISYISKILKKENGCTEFNILDIEFYARDIFSRAAALQNSYDTFNLSIEYLERDDFLSSNFDFEDHYKYHLEHFYLSLFSIIDRCYLLVGSALLLNDSDIEKIGGKSVIDKRIKSIPRLTDLMQTLNKLNKDVKKMKELRNKISHTTSYSNEHLNALGYFRSLPEMMPDVLNKSSLIDAQITIKKGLIKKTKIEIENIKNQLENNLNDVFNELSNIFLAVEKTYSKEA